ncbi:hypothetical protein [Sinomicrobium sp. M5D2P9]
MALQDIITQLWVKAAGKKINPETHRWLIGPVGGDKVIKDQFIQELAKREGLEISRNDPHAGLLLNIEEIGVSLSERPFLNKQIIHFYENTADYDFEIWSEWKYIFRPFGKLLSLLFSKRLQQLNLPLNPMDSSQGFRSEIIKLYNPGNRQIKWTVWYRTLKQTHDVVYSGVYTTCQNPNFKLPLLKVVFPLPNGNATVIMTKTIEEDGSLLLSSNGKKFGDNGFYFTLTDKKGRYYAKFVRSMHEWIRVYVDSEGILRADHHLNFYGLRFLNLHYKMTGRL